MNNLVLVVDDDLGVREALSTFLEIEDLKTVEAKNGVEALEMLKTNKDIKFVISDIRMPNGDGIFLVNEIRKIDPVLPFVVLISGQADITREDAIKMGALDLFVKPPDMDKLISLIKDSISK
jgi:DNA-binding NtrC family response regulator